MFKFIKNSLLLLLITVLIFHIFWFPKEALAFSTAGVTLWFEQMIPALLPFMILSGFMVRYRMTDYIVAAFRPLFGRLFNVNSHCLYVILTGFLCGFPIGAKTTADLYEIKQINKAEAQFLLSFCNNIGPAYFTGVVLSILPKNISVFSLLFGMYGIPFCYGLFLRYTFYRHILTAALVPCRNPKTTPSLMNALDCSIVSGMQSITKLGGYMIFFHLLYILPFQITRLLPGISLSVRPISALLLEITGGVMAAGEEYAFAILVLLHFGGFSCIAQTNSMIQQTDLSLKNYIVHKVIQSILAYFYYQKILLY